MATNYSSNFNTTNQYIKYRIVAEDVSVDLAGNKSGVKVQVQVWRTNTGYTTYGTGTCTVYINGTKYTSDITTSKKFTHNSYTVVFEKTVTGIAHNADGTKSITITAKIDHSRFDSSGTGSMTKTLTKTNGSGYTVTYNANGGTGAPSAQKKYHGKALTLSSAKPTRTGYDFVGWGTSATDKEVNYASGASYVANANITLYAIWMKQIHLLYGSHGGTGKPEDETQYIYNNEEVKATFTVSSIESTRYGYDFLGWSSKLDATTADYVGGDKITLTESVTLLAVWAKAKYALTIKPNGGVWDGTTGASVIQKEYKDTYDIANPTWVGHEFTGWKLSGGGSLSGTTYTFGGSNGVLEATWDSNEFPVIYDANGGTVRGNSSFTEMIDYGSYASLPVAEMKNYVFAGWFTEPSGGELVTNLMVTGATTLYAQYEIDASVYVKVNGEWKCGVAFANGKDKGHTKVNDNGTWKDGFC